MATKAELEAEIERLKQVIRSQEAAVRQLSLEKGVKISLPHFDYGMKSCLMFDDEGHKCADAIMALVWKVVTEHGIKNVPGVVATKDVLQTRDWHGGESYVVPEVAAKLIVGLINSVGDYGAAMYRTGYSEGSSLLVKLAKGKVSADAYEEDLQRGTSQSVSPGSMWKIVER